MITRSFRMCLVLGALTLSLALAGLAEARSLSKTLARTGLLPQDMQIMTATTDSLFAGTPVAGARKDWTNAETGSRGNVEIRGFKDGCAVVSHVFRPGGAERTQQVDVIRCRAADGGWVEQ